MDPVGFSPGRPQYGSESYLLADKALYLFSFNKVKEAISPDGVISDAGARTALKVIPTFNPR